MSLQRSSTEVVEIAVVSWTRECRDLVSRAIRLVSLIPGYSIRRAFDFE